MRSINKFGGLALALVSLVGIIAPVKAQDKIGRFTALSAVPRIQALSDEQIMRLRTRGTPYFEIRLLPNATGSLTLPQDALKVYLSNNNMASLEVRDKRVLDIQAKALGEANIAVFIKQTPDDCVGKLIMCQIIVLQPSLSHKAQARSKSEYQLVPIKHQPNR